MSHKITLKITYFLIFLTVFAVPPHFALGYESYTVGTVTNTATFRFDNENWFTAPHPMIASFTIQDDGSSYGLTETGVSFVQYNVPNDVGIRVQRFEIQDHYHYIVEGEIVYTIEEFSARLAQAYEKQTATQTT